LDGGSQNLREFIIEGSPLVFISSE